MEAPILDVCETGTLETAVDTLTLDIVVTGIIVSECNYIGGVVAEATKWPLWWGRWISVLAARLSVSVASVGAAGGPGRGSGKVAAPSFDPHRSQPAHTNGIT